MNPPHSNQRPSQPPLDHVVVSHASGLEIGEAVLERLEELDDTIFAALEGDADALDRSRTLWTDAQQQLDPPLIEESQRQYARRAESVWRAYQAKPGESLAQAFAALEVLGLVLEDEQRAG